MNTPPPSCRACVWCVLEDYGYSNYTIEGTHQGCLLKLNPGFPLDDSFYGETPANKYAQECTRYKIGHPIHFDVDRNQGGVINYIEDEEVKAYWLLAMGDYDVWDNIINGIYINVRR